MAQWSKFFQETYEHCVERLGADDGKEYFTLLTAQLLQRLVKNLSKVSWANLEFLFAFVSELAKHASKVVKTTDDEEALKYIQAIVDKASPPDLVKEGVAAFSKSSYLWENWMIQCFNLQNGKKLIEFASENADRRESQSKTISGISDSLLALTNMDANRLGTDFSYSVSIAQQLKKARKAVHDPGKEPASKINSCVFYYVYE